MHGERLVNGQDVAGDLTEVSPVRARQSVPTRPAAALPVQLPTLPWSKIGARRVQSTERMAVFGRTPWA
jgi:hypothetical protein